MNSSAQSNKMSWVFKWDWDEMCGPDGLAIWSTTHKDLGLCFQELCLKVLIIFIMQAFLYNVFILIHSISIESFSRFQYSLFLLLCQLTTVGGKIDGLYGTLA